MGGSMCTERLRKPDQLWRRAMEEVHNNTKHITALAAVKVAEGSMTVAQADSWCKGEISKVTLLSEKLLSALWDKYDADHNGELSQQELTLLVKEYLENGQREAKLSVERALGDQFAALGLSAREVALYRNNPEVEARIKAAEDEMVRLFNGYLFRLTEVTEKMYRKMDVNSDGKIERHEFIARFGPVCEEVCDVSSLKFTLLRIHS